MEDNRLLTLEEAKATEFLVYEEKNGDRPYPAMNVGNQIHIADECDTWDGADVSLFGTAYRFWAHYPAPDDLAANPWPTEANDETDPD